MKLSIIHTGLLIAALATGLSVASCNKEAVSTPPHRNSLNNNEICFSASGLDIDVSTRTSVVSNLDGGFYAIAATGAAGSQSNYWGEVVSVTKSGSSYLTGKYWPASDPGLTSFYASNVSPTFAASGPTVTLADCNTDVVCAHAASPTYGVNCPLTFNHVLARVGTITLNTKSGYELSAVTATLKNGVTGGTYNLRTGAWSSLGAGSDKSTGAFSGNTSAQASDNDIWLIPGTYTISLSYTLTKGDYVYNAVNKTGSVTILAGNTNNITTTAVGVDATEIVFSVSLTAWSPYDVALAFASDQVNSHPFSVAAGRTVKFTTANLMYDGPAANKWHLMENPWSTIEADGIETEGDVSLSSSSQIGLFGWATSGYNSKNPWMTSTTSTDYGPALHSGDWTDDSNEWDWGVHNTIYDYSGMQLSNLRTLTKNEWSYIISNANLSWAKINGVYGALIFSDDYSHPAGLAAITQNFDMSDENVFTSAQFEQMSAAGAVFLPAAGERGGTEVWGIGSDSHYWSSSVSDEKKAWYTYFGGEGAFVSGGNGRYSGYSVRLVQD